MRVGYDQGRKNQILGEAGLVSVRHDWRVKAIEEIDEALAVWATRRIELNRDGQADARYQHVDDMLERRLEYVRVLAGDR